MASEGPSSHVPRSQITYFPSHLALPLTCVLPACLSGVVDLHTPITQTWHTCLSWPGMDGPSLDPGTSSAGAVDRRTVDSLSSDLTALDYRPTRGSFEVTGGLVLWLPAHAHQLSFSRHPGPRPRRIHLWPLYYAPTTHFLGAPPFALPGIWDLSNF